jgi:DNA-binding PadR family transcriptional regulator
MTSKHVLNPTAASLLGFLHDGPQTGWDLVATARLRIGDFWTLTRSQVYRELAAMSDAGLVTAGERGPRDRRPYALTDAGRAAFEAWLDAGPGDETIRVPLLLTLTFGRHLPAARRAEVLAEHRDRRAQRLTRYRNLAEDLEGSDAFAEAALAFGIAYEEATLAWFDALPPEVTGER